MKNFCERLEAIKYPCHDKLLKMLEVKIKEVEEILLKDVKIDENDFFSYLIEYQKACNDNPKLSQYLDRLKGISAKRTTIINDRARAKRESIYAEMSSAELEQLVIS